MGVDEHFTGPPLPRHRYRSSGLPDLPPHGRLSPRQPQRGLGRALPPGPSPGACHPAPVTSRSRRPRQASPSPQLRSAKHERCRLCAGVRPGRLGIVLQPHRIYRLQSRCSRSCQRDSNPASMGRPQPGGSSRAQRSGMQTAPAHSQQQVRKNRNNCGYHVIFAGIARRCKDSTCNSRTT
jgi:hypothetical protein